MGHIAVATCSCGFKSENLRCAAGMSNCDSVCDAPVICAACGHVGTANILGDLPVICPHCGSIDVEVAVIVGPLFRGPPESIASWTVSIMDRTAAFFLPGPYPCPVCGKKELRIHGVGLWD